MSDKRPKAIVWTEEERATFLRHVCAEADIVVVGAGSPAKGRSSSVAAEFGCKIVDDLRSALTEGECDTVVLGSTESFGDAATPSDAAAVLAAHQRGVRVLSLDPLPASAMELTGAWSIPGAGGVSPASGVRFVPLAREAKPFRDATEVLEMFGEARTVLVEACCHPSEGSLGARLFGAVEVMHWLMGDPDSVDAAYAPPRRSQLIPVPGETLRGAHGDVTATFRFDNGRAAAILASDQSGRWSRSITLLGPEGRLRIYDDGFEWVNMQGERVDASRQTKRRGETPTNRAIDLAAEAISRILDPSIPPAGQIDLPGVLASCQAVLLSTRTGQAESPGTIRRMMQVG